MSAVPKLNPVRDRNYLDLLRDQADVITGTYGHDDEKVVPAHIGTMGKGIKSPDNEALPLLDRFHKLQPVMGEMAMWRKYAPDWLLREALRAYARERYRIEHP
jgi:hypothetical protein